MTEDGDDKQISGSVSEVTRRLLLWARRRRPVLLRVEFLDELARKQVVQNLRAQLQNDEIPVHEIELPTDQPEDLAQWLVEKLEKLPPGVVSINGFAIALPEKDPERQRALYSLNLRREVFASLPLCQIWWMPQHIIELFAGRISDLNSWFRLRARLTQLVPAVTSEPSGQILSDMTTQTFGLERVAGLSQNERDIRANELKRLLVEIQAEPEDQRDLAQERRLLSALTEIFHIQAQYKEEEPLLLRLVTIEEASFGSEHPNVATRLNNLAQLYKATNRLKEAEPLMERALKIDDASFGSEHPSVATDLNNLAQLYKATNRLAEAEPLMQRALKIDEATFGSEHPKVALRLSNLALLYKATNRLKEAEPLAKRALAIAEASLGPEHPNVANRLNNLAQLYQATNRLKEAEPMYKRSLAIDETSLGSEHPEVARDLNNLAALYRDTNRLKEAEPLMERCLLILLQFTRRTGHPHPHLETAVNNYGNLLIQMGHTRDEVNNRLKRLAPEMFDKDG